MNTESISNILGEVPPLPDSVWVGVERRIRTRRLVTRSIFSVAASLLMIVGATFAVMNHQARINAVAALEAQSTLEEAVSYLEGASLSQDFSLAMVFDE